MSISILFISIFLALAPTIHATTFIERPFPEAVQDAPIIVRGKINSKHAEWVNGIDGTRRVYTYYDLAVSEAIKGLTTRSGEVLQIRSLGGEKDGMGMIVSGTAQFQLGEDTVVFLSERNSDQSFDVRGLMMGKYNVRQDSDGQEYLVGPGVIPHAHEQRSQSDSTPAKKWALQDLRNLVKQNASETETPQITPQNEKKNYPSASVQQIPPSEPASPLQSTPSEAAGTPDAETEESSWGWLQGGLIVGALIFAGIFVFRRFLR